MTMTFSVPAMDDPAAFRKLLADCLLSNVVIEHILTMGYTTIAMMAHAVGDVDQLDAFVQHVSLVQDGETFQQFSPQTACLRRAVKECMMIALDSGRTVAPDASVPVPVKPKLSAAEVKELKAQFAANYPGELLTPSTTPSLPFISYVKECVDTKTLVWIPWKRRASELDEIEFTETRRPRNDRQLIRSLVSDGEVALEDLPEARVDTGSRVDVALMKFQALLANALAIIGACHLLVIKRFHAKFFDLATVRPRDSNLRAPTLHEVIDAECSAWQSVAELMNEGTWTLNDSLSEVAYCRQVFRTALAPHPKTVQPKPDGRRRRRLPSPKAKAKAKARTGPKADESAPAGSDTIQKYSESWAKKTVDGQGICIRFNTGRCKSGKSCRYAHVCPIPKANGEPCGGAHPAGKHQKSPH